ncbi:MAG: hypothetical protein SGPRY_013733 [Prymnesium sp.]
MLRASHHHLMSASPAPSEEAFDGCEDERVRRLDYPQLRRLPPLQKDMAYFYGDDWQSHVSPSLATRKYVSRVEYCARERPYLLVAHMYTRYLGDLFGGQMMSGMARNSLPLDPGCGTEFYNFEDVKDVKVRQRVVTPAWPDAAFIEQWYGELNQLNLTDEQKQELVDEANLVFALNIDLFDELEGNLLKTFWKLTSSALSTALGLKTTA